MRGGCNILQAAAVFMQKKRKGGLKAVKQRTMKIIFFNQTFRGKINVFQDTSKFIQLSNNFKTNFDRLLFGF